MCVMFFLDVFFCPGSWLLTFLHLLLVTCDFLTFCGISGFAALDICMLSVALGFDCAVASGRMVYVSTCVACSIQTRCAVGQGFNCRAEVVKSQTFWVAPNLTAFDHKMNLSILSCRVWIQGGLATHVAQHAAPRPCHLVRHLPGQTKLGRIGNTQIRDGVNLVNETVMKRQERKGASAFWSAG